VVARVRRVLGTRAAGHTGTLDPFATGLLVVLVGRATRLARFVGASDKTYLATARLGLSTTTDDRTGSPLGSAADLRAVDETAVRDALAGLRGSGWQRPPVYSAKRVGGQRSHRLARRGAAVELAEVPVTVHRIELIEWRPPEATFRATVSAGTYVRALARDIGERLGVGGHLSALRREAVGGLRVEDALPLERLESLTPLMPLTRVLSDLPALELDEAGRAAVRHGRPVADRWAGGEVGRGAEGQRGSEGHVVLLGGGEVVAVARPEGDLLKPVVVLEDP
jgi:tRNA pseudouridine55 synthase